MGGIVVVGTVVAIVVIVTGKAKINTCIHVPSEVVAIESVVAVMPTSVVNIVSSSIVVTTAVSVVISKARKIT